jgi:hypothetical protein
LNEMRASVFQGGIVGQCSAVNRTYGKITAKGIY